MPNTLAADFCVAALEEALAEYCTPEIFNTDQGAQFTAEDFTEVLEANVRISMDGKRRWMGNVFVERLWRSAKHEEVYLHSYESPKAAARAPKDDFAFYNVRRPYQSLASRMPDEIYFGARALKQAA